MPTAFERWVVRQMAKDSGWPGLRRFKPGPGHPYRPASLAAVCLAYGAPVAAVAYAAAFLALADLPDDLVDYRPWMSGYAAATAFAFNAVANYACYLVWNQRVAAGWRGPSAD